MNTCKTCDWYNRKDSIHTCGCPKVHYGYGLTPDIRPDEIEIEDDKGWGMIPGPEFGCIHHSFNKPRGNDLYSVTTDGCVVLLVKGPIAGVPESVRNNVAHVWADTPAQAIERASILQKKGV